MFSITYLTKKNPYNFGLCSKFVWINSSTHNVFIIKRISLKFLMQNLR